MYWAAFSLYKTGGREELYDAASILQELWEEYPELAAEATVQPVHRFGLDAGILVTDPFAD